MRPGPPRRSRTATRCTSAGTVLDRKPMELTRALISAGRRDLDAVTFAGSLEIELLVAAGSVRSVAAAYVGTRSIRSGAAVRRGCQGRKCSVISNTPNGAFSGGFELLRWAYRSCRPGLERAARPWPSMTSPR